MNPIIKQASSLAIFLAIFGSLEKCKAQNYRFVKNSIIIDKLKDLEASGETNLLKLILGPDSHVPSSSDADLVTTYLGRSDDLLEMISIARAHAPAGIVPSIPSTCDEQTFGFEPAQDMFKEFICDTIGKFDDICVEENDGICQVSSNILSDEGGFYFKNNDLLAYFRCLEINGMDYTQCTTGYSSYSSFAAANYALTSYDEPLLSDFLGQGTYDDDTIHLGKGALYLNNLTIAGLFEDGKRYDANWEEFNVKYAALDAITSSYVSKAYTYDTTDPVLLDLYNIFLKGYFVEKYGKGLDGFAKGKLKNNSVRFTRFSGELDGYPCAYAIGVLVAAYCGYSAEDMYEFVEYYYTTDEYDTKCTQPLHVDNVYKKAKVVLQRTDTISRRKRTPFACAKRIKLQRNIG